LFNLLILLRKMFSNHFIFSITILSKCCYRLQLVLLFASIGCIWSILCLKEK